MTGQYHPVHSLPVIKTKSQLQELKGNAAFSDTQSGHNARDDVIGERQSACFLKVWSDDSATLKRWKKKRYSIT